MHHLEHAAAHGLELGRDAVRGVLENRRPPHGLVERDEAAPVVDPGENGAEVRRCVGRTLAGVEEHGQDGAWRTERDERLEPRPPLGPDVDEDGRRVGDGHDEVRQGVVRAKERLEHDLHARGVDVGAREEDARGVAGDEEVVLHQARASSEPQGRRELVHGDASVRDGRAPRRAPRRRSRGS